MIIILRVFDAMLLAEMVSGTSVLFELPSPHAVIILQLFGTYCWSVYLRGSHWERSWSYTWRSTSVEFP
jgi:hypothetical protein